VNPVIWNDHAVIDPFRNGGSGMSLTLRKAASSLGAAALGVSAMTGVGWAAGSPALAGTGPSFSKLSPSQVKARSSGKQERMVVVFDNQLTNLPANRAHRHAPGTPGKQRPRPCRLRW
jgi:hypothetical protein